MKIIVTALLVIATSSALADQYVQGYTRKDGTYVTPHYQSAPNAQRSDNYSSQGNTNPYTGQRGTERNEYSAPPAYNRSSPSYVPNPYEPPKPKKYGY